MQVKDAFREEFEDMGFKDDGPNCLTFSSKGWCHYPECGLDFCPPLPMYIGPEPLTGTTAHPWTVIPVLSSCSLDPSCGLRPVGIVKGTASAGDLPQTLRERQGAYTSLIHWTLVPSCKNKDKSSQFSLGFQPGQNKSLPDFPYISWVDKKAA